MNVHDESMFIALRLAKEGYFGGDPKAVLEAETNIVIQVLKYEIEEKKYLDEFRRLNERRD